MKICTSFLTFALMLAISAPSFAKQVKEEDEEMDERQSKEIEEDEAEKKDGKRRTQR